MIERGWVRTVQGDIELSSLRSGKSIALVHEHLSCDLSLGFGPEYVLTDLGLVTSEVEVAARHGVRLVVDVGNSGHQREPAFLRDVAEASGVAVVASTGHYREGFFPPDVEVKGVDELAADMVCEIETVIAGTHVPAGAIAEIGFTGETATPVEAKVFRAAAKAQAETGAPLLTHTAQGVGWAEQIDLLVKGGADLGRVVIGHMDCLDDNAAHVGVIKSGAWLGFDRINSLRYQSDEVRVARLLDLVEAGLEDRIVISTDTAMVTRLTAHGGAGYAAPVTELVPRLESAGVPAGSIDKLLYENAWRFLAGE